MSDPIIAIVGATGVVGRQVLATLAQRDVDPSTLRLFATQASEGEDLDVGDEALPVEVLSKDSFRGVTVAILAVPPEAARPIAADARAQGVWTVDVSGAFRVDAGVPLVVPGLNDAVLEKFDGRLVSVASPLTQALLSALAPLRNSWGLLVADATMLVGAAFHGKAGLTRLNLQTAALMNGKDPDIETFPHRLAFNVIPAVGGFEGGLSQAERAVLVETARAWAGEALPAVTCTALYVPTYHGATLSIAALLKRPAEVEAVRAALKGDGQLKLLDEPDANIYPMPMLTHDDGAVHVGRVRVIGERVQLLACVDNGQRLAESALDVALRLAAK